MKLGTENRIQKAPETLVCTASETNDSFSCPHDVKKKKSPQTLSICVQKAFWTMLLILNICESKFSLICLLVISALTQWMF